MFVSGIEHSSMSEWMGEIEFSAMKHAINKRHHLFPKERNRATCLHDKLSLVIEFFSDGRLKITLLRCTLKIR